MLSKTAWPGRVQGLLRWQRIVRFSVAGDTNQKPVANNQFLQADQDQPIPLLLEGSDPDGDALSYQVTSLPAHGSISGVAPDLTYTPEPGFSGADSFSFMVSDGK